MRFLLRALVALVAAGGVVLGAPAAHADPEPSLLGGIVGADLGSVVGLVPSLVCGNRLINYNSPVDNSPTLCVNGAIASGNSVDSGNYSNKGNPVNSGNFSNANGATSSNNSSNSANLANGPQKTKVGGLVK
ncbi:hypothetical protein [Herbidospora solisilvae]|uniref:hypothetical protein n=1 Tax=Herbidospora solisilvae TaxID=2696284 RepID=UPI00192A1252|nr:hypothetical protein [Herbidospora solisilvae]